MKTNKNTKYSLAKISTYLMASMLLFSNVANANEFASGAFSQSCFSYPAVAMTPYDRSINQRLYRMTHERVYHANNEKGTILLYGPVAPWNDIYGDGFRFNVSYIDPDGKGKKSSVKAELRFVGANGIKIVSRLNSNDYSYDSIHPNKVQTMSAPLDYSKLDDKEGFYVMRIYIKRTTTKLTPKAFGYSLCSSIF
jgi:hypothetical protein